MQIEAPITCTDCGQLFTGTYYIIIDAQQTPDACAELLSEKLNIVTCPACNGHASVDDLLIYHDGAAEVLIISLPESAVEAMDVNTAMEILRQGVSPQPYLDSPMLVIGKPALKALLPWAAKLVALEQQSIIDIVHALLEIPPSPEIFSAIMIWSAGRKEAGEMKQSLRWLEIGSQIAIAWKNPGLQAEVDLRFGLFYESDRKFKKAIAYYKKAYKGFQQIGLAERAGICQGNLGLCFQAIGKIRSTIVAHQRALRIARDLGIEEMEAAVLANLAGAYRSYGKLYQAVELCEQALAIHRSLEIMRMVAIDLDILGTAYRDIGELTKARSCYEEALTIYRAFRHVLGETSTLSNLGVISQLQGNLDKAEKYYHRALNIHEQIENPDGQATVLNNLAGLAILRGDLNNAENYYHQSFALGDELAL